MINRIKIFHFQSQIIINRLARDPKLECLVQRHQDAVHQGCLARQDALAEKLRMKHGQRSIQSLDGIKHVPPPALAIRQVERSAERARDLELPVVGKHLVAGADDEMAVAQPRRVPNRVRREVADVDLADRRPSGALVEVVEAHLRYEQHAVGETDGEDGLVVGGRRPIQILDGVAGFKVLGVLELLAAHAPDGERGSVGVDQRGLLGGAAADEGGVRDARLHGACREPLDTLALVADSRGPKLDPPGVGVRDGDVTGEDVEEARDDGRRAGWVDRQDVAQLAGVGELKLVVLGDGAVLVSITIGHPCWTFLGNIERQLHLPHNAPFLRGYRGDVRRRVVCHLASRQYEKAQRFPGEFVRGLGQESGR